jgi:hypothetical protein
MVPGAAILLSLNGCEPSVCLGRTSRPDSLPVGIGEGGVQGFAQYIRRQGAIPALRLITQISAPTITFARRVYLDTVIRCAYQAR